MEKQFGSDTSSSLEAIKKGVVVVDTHMVLFCIGFSG